MAEKLTGDNLEKALEERGLPSEGSADEKRAAVENYDASNGVVEAPGEPDQVGEEPEVNDPVADRIAKHGEVPEEERLAQQAHAIGAGSGLGDYPSQDDLNPAFAPNPEDLDPDEDEADDDEADEDE